MRMRMRCNQFGLALAGLLVVSAISLPVKSAVAADAMPKAASEISRKAPIKVYEPGTLAPGAYTVIDRLWVSGWRTVFDVPRYPDAESAVRALLHEAERMGGDGVVNMHCMQSAGVVSRWGGHYCYGSVIKLK